MKLFRCTFASCVLLCCWTLGVFAQNLPKEVKKSVKELQSNGWKPVPGARSLADQMLELYSMQLSDKDGMPRYVIGTRTASGTVFASVRKLAYVQARLEVVNQIESEVFSMCEAVIGDRSLSGSESSQVNTMITTAKVSAAQNVNAMSTVSEIYRELAPDYYEVRVTLAYDADQFKSEITRICTTSNQHK